MNIKLISGLLLLSTMIGSGTALASTTDCQNMYVGRIWVQKGAGLTGVVYLNSPSNSSGSYWTYFNNWTDSERQAALSLLMAAKLSGHKVNIVTEASGGCDIQVKAQDHKHLYLSNQ